MERGDRSNDVRRAPPTDPWTGTQFAVEASVNALGTLSMRVRGDLELSTAHKLLEALDEWLGINECIVDLSHCDFVDSTGIRALIECRHQIGPDANMRLVGLSPHIERTLRRVGFDTLATLETSNARHGRPP